MKFPKETASRLDSSGPRYGQLARFVKHGNEQSDGII